MLVYKDKDTFYSEVLYDAYVHVINKHVFTPTQLIFIWNFMPIP